MTLFSPSTFVASGSTSLARARFTLYAQVALAFDSLLGKIIYDHLEILMIFAET